MIREELPLSWKKSLLAISPGLLATAGLGNTDFSEGMLAGLIILVAFLVSIYWLNNNQVPGWSLMAAGMLTSIGLTIVSGVIGGLAAIIVGKSANTFVLYFLLAILTTLLITSMRTQRVSLFIWVFFALIIACQLAVRVKYFVLAGVSWSVAGQWLIISLYAAVSALLLPLALGIILAKRYGQLAMLFTIGMIYGSIQILIDVNYKVSSQIGGTLGFAVYKATIPFLFTVIAPLWFLRARSPFSRVCGLLIVIGLDVIIDLLIVGLSFGGDLHPIIWISFIPYTISVLLTLALAHLLYQEDKENPIHVSFRPGFTSE